VQHSSYLCNTYVTRADLIAQRGIISRDYICNTCSNDGSTTCEGRPEAALANALALPATRGRAYSIRVSILNIGRYIAITMTPTIIPTPIIMIGSMIEVSAWIEASTSSS
jgi:hypothetical protein